jgi:DNA primase
VAGRIRDADVALVRERSPIAEVVGQYVQLRRAGGDSLKGLCPFHEESTASFHVSPPRGFYHCFGCGASGDVITFVREIETLSFPEAVEKLAAAGGVTLSYELGGPAARQEVSRRQRLLDAHRAAADFYAGQLATPAAAAARDFLEVRGFDRAAAERFGCGYAPGGWDTLLRHLSGQGFTAEELTVGGLAKRSARGTLIDVFRERLIWAVRDRAGAVVGFNARRLREDDPAPKYVNTAETPIFRKGSVLFGVDLARREIARRAQAVVVEGVTDVMACHLAGVPTAVATCGTAFGAEHIRVLRGLLLDQDEFRGEVIFTFDGDAAGRRAAVKAFEDDQAFVAQTFVAVERGGLDPCELRLRSGDAAVRDLVARRVPLFEYVIRTSLGSADLDSVEGREQALRAAIPVVARIKDRSLRDPYAVRLAGWVGHPDEATVLRRVRTAAGEAGPRPRRAVEPRGADDATLRVEREALKLAVQRPVLAGPEFDRLEPEVFTDPTHRGGHRAVTGAGGTATGAGLAAGAWVAAVREQAADDDVRRLVAALAVEPLHFDGDDVERYGRALLARLLELHVTRRIAQLHSRLQRLNPVEATEEYNQLFGELAAMEQHKRGLRERGLA